MDLRNTVVRTGTYLLSMRTSKEGNLFSDSFSIEVVILDRSDYDRGFQNIIQDCSKFKPLSQDPTLQREDKLQRLLRKLNKKGHFEDDYYSRIYPKCSNPARIYGLPKMHKPRQQGAVPPFRPIVSSIGAYNYNLTKYLCNLLTPLIPAEFCAEDSFSFVNEIQKLSIHNKFMVSFDVESLFTNIHEQKYRFSC